MGDRQAAVIANLVARVDGLRKSYQGIKKEIEDDPIRVNFTGAMSSATGAPATFGKSSGTPFTGTTAGSRLDANSVARNTGASLAMQNGSPGAVAGGLGAALVALGVSRPDYGYRASPGERVEAGVGGGGRMPVMELSIPSPRSLTQTDSRALGPWRGRAVDPDVIDAEWEWTNPAAAPAGRRTPPPWGGRRRTPWYERPASMFRPIGRDEAEEEPGLGQPGGPGGNAAGGGRSGIAGLIRNASLVYYGAHALGQISAFGDIGYNPTGNVASLAVRNAQQRNAAVQGLFGPAGGGYAFGSSLGNWLSGNGFVSEDARLQREATVQDNENAINNRSAEVLGQSRLNKLYDTPARIRQEANNAYDIERRSIEQNASLRADQRAKALIDARRSADSNRDRAMADYGVGIATSYANSEVDRRIGRAQFNRDPVEELYQNTIGRAFAQPNTTDSATYRANVYRARVGYRSGLDMFRRQDVEGVVDYMADYEAGGLSRAGESALGERRRITSRRDRMQRMFGTTSWFAGFRAAIGTAAQGELDDVDVAEYRENVGVRTVGQAALLSLADDPYGAQLEESRGAFEQEVGKALPGSTDYRNALIRRGARDMRINQASANARQGIETSQYFRNEALDRHSRYNTEGAAVSGLANDIIERGRAMYRAGFHAESEYEREIGQREIDQRERDYRTTFSGRDVGSILYNPVNPTRTVNPSEVFASYDKARQDVGGEDFRSAYSVTPINPAGGPLDAASITGGKTIADLINEVTRAIMAAAGTTQ